MVLISLVSLWHSRPARVLTHADSDAEESMPAFSYTPEGCGIVELSALVLGPSDISCGIVGD